MSRRCVLFKKVNRSLEESLLYLWPVRCDPLRWALFLGTGLLVWRSPGRAEGVRQLQDAAIRQPLFAQDLPPLKSTTTAPGALQQQKYSGTLLQSSVVIALPGIYGVELPKRDPLPVPTQVCPTLEGSQSGCRLGQDWALGSDSLHPSKPQCGCCPERVGEYTPQSGSLDQPHR